MKDLISGIQQIGIGVADVEEAFAWYRAATGVDVPILNADGVAEQMLRYTGGQAVRRHAILALNLNGGGGLELWQLKTRPPKQASFNVEIGDLGIHIAKIKSFDIARSFSALREAGADVGTEVLRDPAGRQCFFTRDPWGNILQVVESTSWFGRSGKSATGGALGAWIGVSNMDKALGFYRDFLGYETVAYDSPGEFVDLAGLPGGNRRVRRVLLTQSGDRDGAFSELLGRGEIELIEAQDYHPRRRFEDRWWGDLGFIHLCFDVLDMPEVRKRCAAYGHPFTCESDPAFEMGDADGQFSYIEDPDGTLIEFVETHKIPILKKIGWYLHLKKRDTRKPLPRFILKALRLARVK
ncbi:MAG: VOC family protein [Spirochaetota bacterium]